MCVCCNIIQLYCMHVVLIVCCCMYVLSVLIAMCCMHVVLIVCCCVVCVVCIYSCCCTYVCTGKEERLWPIVRLIIIIIIIKNACYQRNHQFLYSNIIVIFRELQYPYLHPQKSYIRTMMSIQLLEV